MSLCLLIAISGFWGAADNVQAASGDTQVSFVIEAEDIPESGQTVDRGEGTGPGAAKTGDESRLEGYAVMLGLSAPAILILLLTAARKEKKENDF